MRFLVLFVSIFLLAIEGIAQSEGISPNYSFNIRKKIEPPYLEFVPGSLHFVDQDRNNTINANESCALEFDLKNSGTGDGLNLTAKMVASGSNHGLKFSEKQAIANVSKGQTIHCELSIASSMETQDGVVIFQIEIEEPNGFNSDVVELEVNTKKFIEPRVCVPDYTVYSADGSTNLTLKKPFSVQLLVQNTGQGIARDVRYKLIHPDMCFVLGGEEAGSFAALQPGETKSLEFQLVLNAKFEGTSLNLGLDISESMGKYSTNWNTTLNLNQALAPQKLIVESTSDNAIQVEIASLRSDVDKDIPTRLTKNEQRYALIIGNEDYSKYQPGLDREVNVAFAANDARVVAEYTEKTLGYPKKNIVVLIDATKGQITQHLAQLKRLIEVERGEAEVLFYYSGHGLPEEGTNTPYLIPVDVSGTQPTNGVALQEVYSTLAAFPAKKVTVLLDACFSGGARQQELVALKGVKVKANVEQVPANLIVLASSSGNEASAVYYEKQHGYFTYFLLKEWKEGSSQGSMKQSMELIQQNVAREAARTGKKQTPTALLGPSVLNQWEKLEW